MHAVCVFWTPRTWADGDARDGVFAGLERRLHGPRLQVEGHNLAAGACSVHDAWLARGGGNRRHAAARGVHRGRVRQKRVCGHANPAKFLLTPLRSPLRAI